MSDGGEREPSKPPPAPESGSPADVLRAHVPPAAQRQLTAVLLTLILIASFALKLQNLGHLALRGLDESFHAIVAVNLLEHPLTPTLIDQPFRHYDYRDWQTNHVWLHKGIVPLWQIAISYALFGVETFALRLPSALLSTLSVLLTYLIGRELVDRSAALVGAALQAFSPAMFMLVHGYAFSDHIDAALVFWVELGIWFVLRARRTGRLSDATLAGAAQGLAFLSKMYPALIITGVGLTAWVLSSAWHGRPAHAQAAAAANAPAGRLCHVKFHGRHLLAVILASVIIAAPWLIWTAARFPQEFRYEYWHALQHLGADIEGWAGPWDRLIFGYALAANYVFYPSILAAVALLIVRAIRQRDEGLAIVLAWTLGVFVTFTIAKSKTPSATAIGWPALWLLYGAMISRAARGDTLLLGAWMVATILAVFLRGEMNVVGIGGEAGQVLRQNAWVLWHALAAIMAGIVAGLVLWRAQHVVSMVLFMLGLAGSLWLFALWTGRAWAVVQLNVNEPAFVQMGTFARTRLPRESVLLLEEREKVERNTLMFRARRTTYAVTPDDWRQTAREVVHAGGIPFLVTHRDLQLQPILTDQRENRTLYRLTPRDLDLSVGTQPATQTVR